MNYEKRDKIVKDVLEKWETTKPDEKAKWLENKNKHESQIEERRKTLKELQSKTFRWDDPEQGANAYKIKLLEDKI